MTVRLWPQSRNRTIIQKALPLGRGDAVHLEGETRDLPGGGVPMQDTPVDGMVDEGDDPHQGFSGFVRLASGHGLFDLAGKGSHRHDRLAVPLATTGISPDIFLG